MLATMLVDLDHIFACRDMFPNEGGIQTIALDHLIECQEIFNPNRCSIGFHPLHSYFAIGVYGIMLCFPKLRIVATGLILHMLTDLQDCLWL